MYKCPHCCIWLSSKYNLKRHLNKKNKCNSYKDSGLICPECFSNIHSISFSEISLV